MQCAQGLRTHNSREGQGVGGKMLVVMEVVPKDTLRKDQKRKGGRVSGGGKRLRQFRERKELVQSLR